MLRQIATKSRPKKNQIFSPRPKEKQKNKLIKLIKLLKLCLAPSSLFGLVGSPKKRRKKGKKREKHIEKHFLKKIVFFLFSSFKFFLFSPLFLFLFFFFFGPPSLTPSSPSPHPFWFPCCVGSHPPPFRLAVFTCFWLGGLRSLPPPRVSLSPSWSCRLPSLVFLVVSLPLVVWGVSPLAVWSVSPPLLVGLHFWLGRLPFALEKYQKKRKKKKRRKTEKKE